MFEYFESLKNILKFEDYLNSDILIIICIDRQTDR